MNRERRGRAYERDGRRARSGSESSDESPGPLTPPLHEHILAPFAAPRITIDEADDEHEHGWEQDKRGRSWQTPIHVCHEAHEDEALHSPFADSDSPIHQAKPFLEVTDYRPSYPKRRSPRHSPIHAYVVPEPTIVEDDYFHPTRNSTESLGLGLDLGTSHADLSPCADEIEDTEDLIDRPSHTAELDPIRHPSSFTPPSNPNDGKRRTFKGMKYAIRLRWVAFKLRVRMSAFRTRRRMGLV